MSNLPSATPPAYAPAGAGARKGTAARPRVLLAVDRPGLRVALARLILSLDAEAMVAGNPTAARAARQISAALVGARFGDGQGDALARDLRARDPALPLVLVSGGPSGLARMTTGVGETPAWEPIQLTRLGELIREALRVRASLGTPLEGESVA